MLMFQMFVYRKITKNKFKYENTVIVIVDIIFGHDQKYIPGHYFFGQIKLLAKTYH